MPKTKKPKKVEKKIFPVGFVLNEPKVTLLGYEIKAVIPTGPYANIQPTIAVMAESLEAAENYVIPHINKLFGDFLNKSEKVNQAVPDISTRPVETTSENYARAKQAIDSCKNKECLALIKERIEKSVKLVKFEKENLLAYIANK